MMKTSILSLLAPAVLALILAGCSSSQKSDDAPAAGTSGNQAASGSMEDALDETPKSETVSPPPPAPSTSTFSKSALDPKYAAISKAIRSGQPALVQDEASKILGTNPNDATALNALAMIHLRRGKTEAAKLLLLRALEKNGQNAGLHNNLGVALLEQGDTVGALAEFKKALQLDDSHGEALGNLGSLYMQTGDYNKAAPFLEQSYKKNNTNLAIANNYALSLRHRKEYDSASRIYAAALKMNSKDIPTLLNYAILLIDFMNKPKDGLELVYKLKFLDTDRKDVLARANALEKKAKSQLQ